MQAELEKKQTGPRASEKPGRAPEVAAGSFKPAEKTTARIFDLNRFAGDNQTSAELVETVKNGLDEIDSVLQKMRAISEEASGDKMSAYERELAQKAIDGYIAEVDRIVEETESKAARLPNTPGSQH